MTTEQYKIGSLINPLTITGLSDVAYPRANGCTVSVAARVDTFLCHQNFFVRPPRPQVYPVCAINFVIPQMTQAEVEIIDGETFEIDGAVTRAGIVLHTALILQKTLGFKQNLRIKAENLHAVQHGGFGSSAALQTAVAIAINELFGSKIPSSHLIRLLAQNYGEESDTEGFLSPMASIGGASASALLSGSNVIIIGGESEVWCAQCIPDEYSAVVAIPKIDSLPSGAVDLELYKKGFQLFEQIGSEWGYLKEDILRNKIIPSLMKGDTRALFSAINMYTIGGYGDIPQYFRNRWISHSIFMDEFIHEIYSRLFRKLSVHEHCFFVSSGGPSIVFITKDADYVCDVLRSIGTFDMVTFPLHHHGPDIRFT